MGAHTIGHADKENSGFDGYWAGEEEESVFNVTYYEVMIDPTLKWVNEVKFSNIEVIYLFLVFLLKIFKLIVVLDKVVFGW